MRIIFVRHGEPDYLNDCLTAEGRRQAEACAERLVPEGISAVYASPMGRAYETASFTAKRLGLEVQVLPFMHEVSWGGEGVPDEGHPWTLSDRMLTEQNYDFCRQDWRTHPWYRDNTITPYYDMISEAFDEFLLTQHYRHDRNRYLCMTDKRETIAVFSHGGSGGCALAHLLSLPMPYVMTVLPYDFTSIIILEFPVRKGEYVHPRIELFNDNAHWRTSSGSPVFQQRPDND
ncbi:MAG: histidine phosphatase family protein [Bacteroidales bacterium]|nr:histidine phosphatase family protein [Bacteroidales bacterium]MBR4459079.1 histidine phosphatase family protein [Clostridia bacterium]